MAGVPRKVRVLMSEPSPGARTNPYVSQLFAALDGVDGVNVEPMNIKHLLWGQFDVFHVHWPETLVRKSTPLRSLLGASSLAWFLLRTSRTRPAVVRTVHNLDPHERLGWPGSVLVKALERRTVCAIHLTDATRMDRNERQFVIPHGHYRDWYVDAPRLAPIRGRLAYFGLLREYKGVESLISAFAAHEGLGYSLHVTGGGASPSYEELLRSLADADDRVRLRTEYLNEDELARHITSAELVVLPYRYMVNSGAALLALSLDRPILVRASQSMKELQSEVGPGWVSLFDGELSAADLRSALVAARGAATDVGPNLASRDWRAAALGHENVYRAALDDR